MIIGNTLVHADFYGGRGIRIEKHFRRITFANPPRGVSVLIGHYDVDSEHDCEREDFVLRVVDVDFVAVAP